MSKYLRACHIVCRTRLKTVNYRPCNHSSDTLPNNKSTYPDIRHTFVQNSNLTTAEEVQPVHDCHLRTTFLERILFKFRKETLFWFNMFYINRLLYIMFVISVLTRRRTVPAQLVSAGGSAYNDCLQVSWCSYKETTFMNELSAPINADWLRFSATSGMLCDRRI